MSSSSRKQVKEKVTKKLDVALDTLYRLWEEIGIDETQTEQRAGTVALHVCKLVDEMVSEEQQMHDEMALNIQRYQTDLTKLCLEMGLPVFQVSQQLSMVQKEKELRIKLDSMKLEKQNRLGRLRQLLAQDEALCRRLGSNPHHLPSHTPPTREQLLQMEAHIRKLQEEKEKRHKEFLSTKKKVLALCTEMDYQPETSLEQDLICEDEEAVQLTEDHLTSIKNMVQDLERKKEALQQEVEELWMRIHSLWDRIDLPEEAKEEFTSCHKGHGSGVMSGLRAEVHRCEQLKHTNLSRFVEGARKEIADWWDRCFYSKQQRDAFQAYYEEMCTEELLQLHEVELKRLQDYYKSHQPLLELVARREKLWRDMVEFEKSASDPKRFFNDRGGKFLKEEKARKKLMKELPKLEEDVKEEIERWESEHCQQFLVGGLPYQQYVEQQWTILRQQKDQEKEDRQKNRAKQMEEDMIYGSKPTPNTPVKRRIVHTPTRTPLKARKVMVEDSISVRINIEYTQLDENPRTPSSMGRPAQPRQPLAVVKPPNKAMNSFRRRSVRQARQCLRRSIQKGHSGGEGGKTLGTLPSAKPVLYSLQTTKGLNQTARSNCRSSILPTSSASPHRPR